MAQMFHSIPLDDSNVLAIPPTVVLYGAPGTGKSTEMARAFNKVLYVQSSPTILHAYADFMQKNPKLGLKMPQRVTFDEKLVALSENSPTKALVNIITTYIGSCDSNQCPYEGIVFDEWSTILERVFAELRTDPWGKFKGRNGSFNIFAAIDYFKSIHRAALSIARRTRRMVGFISHYQGPRYDEEEGSPTRGKLKWPGGPKMPQGASDQVVELCAEADVVVQMTVKEPGLSLDGSASKAGARVFQTQLDNAWFRKVRGFGIAPEEPLDIETGKGLRELLKLAGYPV